MTLQGQQVHSHPSMPPHIVHTERSGANPPSVFPIVFPYTLVFPSKHVSVKAGKGNLLFYSFSNLSVISPMPQLILQPFRRFTYVTSHSPTLPLLHLRHSSFSNPSFASPTSQALHLAGRPCFLPELLLLINGFYIMQILEFWRDMLLQTVFQASEEFLMV